MMIALFLCTNAMAALNPNDDITGLWLSKKQDVAVRVKPCGNEYCGYIAWLRKDVKQTSKDNQPLCRAKVLWGFHAVKNKGQIVWTGGTIYQAAENASYKGRIELIDANRLEARAFIGLPIFGKTKIFARTSEKSHPPCHIAQK